MPLAQKPHRPKPEVELLRRERISFEDAERLLQQSLRPSKSDEQAFVEVPGSFLVSFRNIPSVVQSLQDDWVTWKPKQRPRESCFVQVTGRLETHLHPVFLSDLGLGLRGAAGFLLHRWVDTLGCIPLGFVELKPASTHAAVVAESPYVHFLMQFRAVGFAPRKGDWLVGRVSPTQVSAGMNVTILGLLNCHVRGKELPEDLQFCSESKRWLDTRSTAEDGATNGGISGEPPDRVWLKLLADPLVDRMNKHGSLAPELKCELGWPAEEMAERLKEARASALARNGEGKREKPPRTSTASSASGTKRKRPPAEADEQEEDAWRSPAKGGRGSGASSRGRGQGRGGGGEVATTSAAPKKAKKEPKVAKEGKESATPPAVASPATAKKEKKKKRKEDPEQLLDGY